MSRFCINWDVSFNNEQKKIGKDCPTFIIAEIGINHNGDLELAKKGIKAAKEAGADAVKFQNYCTDDFLLNDDLLYTYNNGDKCIIESQRAMFQRCEFSFEEFEKLTQYCKQEDIMMISTPSGVSGVRDIMELGLPIIKNASDSMEHIQLLESESSSGLPCILSCGMAGLAEIEKALSIFEKRKNMKVALLVCTSQYPTEIDQVNLKRILTLGQAFGCIVGFSDHTCGVVASTAAVAIGAKIIEKHFTLDKNMAGPDHAFSADQGEFSKLVKAIRDVEACMGDGYFVKEQYGQVKEKYGLSLQYNKVLRKDDILVEEDFSFSRPGNGLKYESKQYFLGKKLKRSVSKGQLVSFYDIL